MLRRFAVLLVVLGALAALSRPAYGVAADAGRVQQTPPPTGQVPLPGHVLSVLPQAVKQVHSAAQAAAATAEPLTLTLVLNRTDEAGFQAFLAGVQNPTSRQPKSGTSEACEY